MNARLVSRGIVLAGVLVFLLPFISRASPGLALPPPVVSFYSVFMSAPLSLPLVSDYWARVVPLLLLFAVVDFLGCLVAPAPHVPASHTFHDTRTTRSEQGHESGELAAREIPVYHGRVVVPRFVVSGRLNKKAIEELRLMVEELRGSTGETGEREISARMARLSLEPSGSGREEQGIEKYFVGDLEEYRPGSYLGEEELEEPRDEWSERDVDPYLIKISKKHGVPVQNILELLRYISRARHAGLDARTIIESLVEAGWPQDLVEEVMVYSQ